MAQRPPAHQGEPDAKAQKRALDLIAEDCKRICTTNLARPFTTLQDAMEHLLPFHILGSMAGDEADAEEEDIAAALAPEGGRLLCTRREMASELAARKAVELHGRVEDLRQRMVRLDNRYRMRHSRPLPEEELFIAQVHKEVAERQLEAAKAAAQRPPGSASSSDDEEEETAPHA